jgi:hypothetical protein
LCAEQMTIPLVTRLVQQFDGLEKDIIVALKTNNQSALHQLVADDFEARMSYAPGSPISRETWLLQSLNQAKNYNVVIGQMAVHDFKQMMVVSFRWQSLSLVDVWTKEQERWVLKVRYASDVTSNAGTLADPVPSPETINKKY